MTPVLYFLFRSTIVAWQLVFQKVILNSFQLQSIQCARLHPSHIVWTVILKVPKTIPSLRPAEITNEIFNSKKASPAVRGHPWPPLRPPWPRLDSTGYLYKIEEVTWLAVRIITICLHRHCLVLLTQVHIMLLRTGYSIHIIFSNGKKVTLFIQFCPEVVFLSQMLPRKLGKK